MTRSRTPDLVAGIRYVSRIRIWPQLTQEIFWHAEFFRWLPKHKVGEIDQSHLLQLSLPFNWAASLILSTKAGAANTEETAWSALGLDHLASVSFFFPTLPPSKTCFTDLGYFPRFILFWKDWRSQDGLVLHFSFDHEALAPGCYGREWPIGIPASPTRCIIWGRLVALPFCVLSPENRRVVLLTW